MSSEKSTVSWETAYFVLGNSVSCVRVFGFVLVLKLLPNDLHRRVLFRHVR